MPQQKNQHFVPKCHFKPFSLNKAGAAINLYNIVRHKHIPNVPIKGQCARNYFYGEDRELENILQLTEEKYARFVRIAQEGKQLSHQELETLKMFALIQYFRTEAAVQRRMEAEELMRRAIYEGRSVAPPQIASERDLIIQSMGMCVRSWTYVEDLKVCILKTTCPHSFVTSDDPTVLTNRWYGQKRSSRNFGIMSSGALVFMPLSPQLYLMCYDGKVYTLGDKTGCYSHLSGLKDVLALNELQYLKAGENIYYSNLEDRNRIESEFCNVAAARAEGSYEVRAFVPVEELPDRTNYRVATDQERQTAKQALYTLMFQHPVPSRWLSGLRYRPSPPMYSNGSSVGFVRKPEWLRRKR